MQGAAQRPGACWEASFNEDSDVSPRLERFQGLATRSAFVVGIVLDEKENKMELVLDPVRAPRALTHVLKILFILQRRWRSAAAPTSADFSLLFFVFHWLKSEKLDGGGLPEQQFGFSPLRNDGNAA